MKISQIIDFFGYAIYGALACWPSGACITRSCSTGRWGESRSANNPSILIRQVGDLCKTGKVDAAASICQGPPLLAHGAGAADGRGADEPLQGAGEDQASAGDGVPHRGHRRAREPAGDDLDDRPDGSAARPAGHGGVDDRGVRPDRRGRESRALRPGQRHQSGSLGDRLGASDRDPLDDRRQRHPRQAPLPSRPDRAAAPGFSRGPRGDRKPRQTRLEPDSTRRRQGRPASLSLPVESGLRRMAHVG